MFHANIMATLSNYEQQKNLEALWGSAWQKLTPKQQQLVTEVFSKQPKKSAYSVISENSCCLSENPLTAGN